MPARLDSRGACATPPTSRLQSQRSEWLRRERRLDAVAALLLCGAVGLVCWALPVVA